MKELGVTLDSLAALREFRKAKEPDPVMAAFLADQAGATAINVQLRSDRRHIQERDVQLLTQTVNGELNLVAAPSQEMARFVLTAKPRRITFVPERLEEVGGGGGLDVILNNSQMRQLIKMMRESSIDSSVFVDPELEQIKAAHQVEAAGVELSAEAYVTARDSDTAKRELRRLSDCARLGAKLSLHVSVSYGLTLRNAPPLLKLQGLNRLAVGHSLVARAVIIGFDAAVREWMALLTRPV